MGILESSNAAALLIDQNRCVSPSDGLPETGNQGLQLIGRLAIITEQNQTERIGLVEKSGFVIGELRSAAAKNNCPWQGPVRGEQ